MKIFPGNKSITGIISGTGLFLLALAVRLPWLWEVPRYIDELREVHLGYLIYRGEALPLHNAAHEIGALHNYILAGIFRVFGVNIYWPRLYVAITSASTVLLVYYLGRRLYNRWTGIIAAGLLLTNGMHILVTHMAWANCTTPFFFTLALVATWRAEEQKSGNWLAITGFLWALTLQTHSSVVIYILAVCIYIFILRIEEFKKISFKYHIYAVIAFLTGYANMIAYNISSKGESIRWIFTKDYTLEPNPGVASFGKNLLAMWIELMRAVSSTYANQESLWNYFAYPFFSLAVFLLGLGIYRSVKERKNLLVLIITGGFLIIPWINHRYGFFVVTRYIMPVVIASLLLTAYGISVFLDTVFKRHERVKSGLGILLFIIAGMQLVPFYLYCDQLNETSMSNNLSLKLVRAVCKLTQNNKATVLLDPEIGLENDPLPTLFKFCKVNSEKILYQKMGMAKWLAGIKKDPYLQYAILSRHTFQQLQQEIELERLKVYSRICLFPDSFKSKVLQRVYLVKITPPKK